MLSVVEYKLLIRDNKEILTVIPLVTETSLTELVNIKLDKVLVISITILGFIGEEERVNLEAVKDNPVFIAGEFIELFKLIILG